MTGVAVPHMVNTRRGFVTALIAALCVAHHLLLTEVLLPLTLKRSSHVREPPVGARKNYNI